MSHISDANTYEALTSDSAGRLGSSVHHHWIAKVDEVNMAVAPPAPRPLRIEAAPQNVVIDLRRSAIIVIDMQNDFCTEGGWVDHIGGNYMAERVAIEPLQALLPALREAGVPVIYVNWGNRPDLANMAPPQIHLYKNSGSGVGLGDPLPNGRGNVLEKGSWAAAVVDELAPLAGDIQVDKHRISGFWDTPLDSILRNLGIKSILFAGCNTDQCVLHTLTDANFLGYGCVMVEDCCATSSPDFCVQATIWNVKKCFGFVTDSKRVIDALAVQSQTP